MPPALRRFAWWSFFVTEAVLVAAASAYVGLGTLDFWLVMIAAVLASVTYVIVVRRTPVPRLTEATIASERWYWF